LNTVNLPGSDSTCQLLFSSSWKVTVTEC